jgi:hypothetical protein
MGRAVSILMLLTLLVGCAKPSRPAASDGDFIEPLRVSIAPPGGWIAQPDVVARDSHHRTWVSPTGDTAVGVVHFRMPLPVGHELAFKYGFLREMKKSTGEATVLEQKWDDAGRFLFVDVEGGEYRVRTHFFVRGLTGWAIYAGTLRARPINESELSEAARSRDAARVVP